MQHNAERIVVGAAACITALVTTASPLVAQEVIELPAEDRMARPPTSRNCPGWDPSWAMNGTLSDRSRMSTSTDRATSTSSMARSPEDHGRGPSGESCPPGRPGGRGAPASSAEPATYGHSPSAVTRASRSTTRRRRAFVLFGAGRRVRTGNPAGWPQIRPRFRGCSARTVSQSVVSTGEVQYLDFDATYSNRHSGTSCATG